MYMIKHIDYCFILTGEQWKFLRSKKYKIDRMECFHTLVDKTVQENTLIDISDHRQIELYKGQFMVTDVELSKLWKLDRKTCAKLMKKMESEGIFTCTKVAEVSVYTMHSFSGWYIDGQFCKNDYYRKSPAPGYSPYFKMPEQNKIIVKPAEKDNDKTNVTAKGSNGDQTKSSPTPSVQIFDAGNVKQNVSSPPRSTSQDLFGNQYNNTGGSSRN